ncbi:MAG: DNA translocase FtsK 4TM domain-containing protein, partial [Pseudomonadota bacterium]|nr:DNA translocase FtsK 4TM domain-containing protein [Pseudomonadota bacterium]
MQKSEPSDEVRTIMQRLTREGTLIVFFLMALYLTIALLSYSPSDPGFTTTGFNEDVANVVGVYGAYIADALLHVFGYLAFGFPLLLTYKVYTSFREEQLSAEFSWPMFGFRVLGHSLLMLASCGLATIHFNVPEDAPYIAGGVLGSVMVDLSLPLLASLGSTLLLFAMFLFGLTISASISWLNVIDKLGAWTLGTISLLTEKGQKWLEQRKQALATKARLESRKKVLDIHIQKEKRRVPPTIKEPPRKNAVKSTRVEKERQGSLFEPSSLKELPAIRLLDAWQEIHESGFSKESLEAMSKLLELKLGDFGIEIEVTAVNPGPVITRFEVQPAPGVKVSRITNLAKDLARSLAVVS